MGTEPRRRRKVDRATLRAARADRGRPFNAIVREAVAGLPPELAERMDNVDIIVRARPSPADLRTMGVRHGRTLLGLYHGTPLIHRTQGYNLTLPDRIYLFRQPLEAISRDEDELIANIRHTVVHEIAHHFGISDERLHQIGAY